MNHPIVLLVERHTGVSYVEIVRPVRTRRASRARWILFYLLLLKGLNMNQISKLLKRDHVGVAYGLEHLSIERKLDPAFDNLVRKCEREVWLNHEPEYMI